MYYTLNYDECARWRKLSAWKRNAVRSRSRWRSGWIVWKSFRMIVWDFLLKDWR
jgi:hypothetical protein